MLRSDGFVCGPVPDYRTWLDNATMVDLGTSYDSYKYPGLCDPERAAWRIFHDAIAATYRLMELYKEDGVRFRKVASELSVLPCLMSWHPAAEPFNRRFLKDSRSGEQ